MCCCRLTQLNVDYTIALALACALAFKYIFIDGDSQLGDTTATPVIPNDVASASGDLVEGML